MLGVLPESFLTAGFHVVYVFLCVLAHTRVVAVGANDDMLAILELRPRVRTAADMARKESSTAPLAIGSSSRPICRMTITLGISAHHVLGLTHICANAGVD